MPDGHHAPVPILGFHHLDEELDDYTSMRPGRYAELVAALSERYAFVTAGAALTGCRPDGRRPLVLAFDDAYASIAEPVLAGLANHGAVGTICVIAGHIGGANVWNRKCGYWRRHLDAGTLRDLREAGFEMASHTLEHHNLTRLPDDLLSGELRDSRAALEDLFGIAVPVLAYPYGRHDDRVRAAAGRHYSYALTTTTKPGGIDPSAHRLQLRRFMVTRAMSVADVLTGVEQLWGQPCRV